ncbi:MAG: Holliday junction resolvase RuvX [Pseudomonadota bacterium]
MPGKVEIEDFAASASTGTGRLIGLDLGTKTIGIAVSDGLQSVASARETLTRRKFGQDAEALLTLAAENDAIGFVIGWPVNMDGSVGPRAQATAAFIRNMAARTELPFIAWDERLSTIAAERSMLEADMSRAKRAERIDAAAAAHILQGALDRLRHLRTGHS